MTSATFPRQRVRSAAAAAGLAAALVLTACSSDGDSGSDSSASASPTATASGDTGGSGGSGGSGGTARPGKLQGSWLATTDGKAVALVVNGKEAGLFATGGTVCSGTAGKEADMQMIHLKCTKGAGDRTDGMVESFGATTMKVKWEGGLVETYRKAEGGKLPSGLPSTGLGS
ncbi:hypothetical protein ACIPJS_21695 [Streptomyces sp. NPDC086783]|uniref:hypothetical protein n=1 Tax=Streptomyces sp. NPDC086783 TaxID=3365758 RepID=UPI0038278251